MVVRRCTQAVHRVACMLLWHIRVFRYMLAAVTVHACTKVHTSGRQSRLHAAVAHTGSGRSGARATCGCPGCSLHQPSVVQNWSFAICRDLLRTDCSLVQTQCVSVWLCASLLRAGAMFLGKGRVARTVMPTHTGLLALHSFADRQLK